LVGEEEKVMRKPKKSGKTPLVGDNRRKNAEPEKRAEADKPDEGAQTGSEGLGYLKKPADDAKGGGARRRK
jgi:hypothetical protein